MKKNLIASIFITLEFNPSLRKKPYILIYGVAFLNVCRECVVSDQGQHSWAMLLYAFAIDFVEFATSQPMIHYRLLSDCICLRSESVYALKCPGPIAKST